MHRNLSAAHHSRRNPAAFGRTAERQLWPHAATWLAWALVLASVSVSVARADDSHSVGKAPTTLSAGAALLNRIQDAAIHQNYVGTFVYQEGHQMQSSRITHLADGSGETEKVEVLDGKLREFIRHDDEIRCYVPDSRLVLIETHARADKFPALLAYPNPDLDSYYAITVGATERVAGHNCNVVMVKPKDASRYGYRLWADSATGLLLRAQTIDEDDKVVEQVAFTDVSISGHIDRAAVRPSTSSTEGWRIVRFGASPQDLTGHGWSFGSLPAGFRKISELKRVLESGRELSQIVLSDGLATISVFIEPAANVKQIAGEARRGLMNVITQRRADFWLTIVGEVPTATLHAVADSIDFHAGAH